MPLWPGASSMRMASRCRRPSPMGEAASSIATTSRHRFSKVQGAIRPTQPSGAFPHHRSKSPSRPRWRRVIPGCPDDPITLVVRAELHDQSLHLLAADRPDRRDARAPRAPRTGRAGPGGCASRPGCICPLSGVAARPGFSGAQVRETVQTLFWSRRSAPLTSCCTMTMTGCRHSLQHPIRPIGAGSSAWPFWRRTSSGGLLKVVNPQG